jgi:hypothetical protein
MTRRVLAGVTALLAARLVLDCASFKSADTAPADGGTADQAAEAPSDAPSDAPNAPACRPERCRRS